MRNPDWVDITSSSYRGRWRPEPIDPCYDDLQRRLTSLESLATPTLMIHGGADTRVEPAIAEGLERYFTSSYRRIILDGVGRSPSGEAPMLLRTLRCSI